MWHPAQRVRPIALLSWLLLAAWPAMAGEPAHGTSTHVAAPEAHQRDVGDPTPTPFASNSLGVEFAATVLVEAWNLNERREWLAGGSAAIWWAFTDHAALLVEMHATRVFQSPSRNGFVQGLAPVLRWHVHETGRWTTFVELGPGISWSDTRVPPAARASTTSSWGAQGSRAGWAGRAGSSRGSAGCTSRTRAGKAETATRISNRSGPTWASSSPSNPYLTVWATGYRLRGHGPLTQCVLRVPA